MAEIPHPTKFPENAYRELKPGETYSPMVPPDMRVPELTPRMFIFGLVMNVVFSVAATFLALKAGQGIEAAIPIAILAVGLSGFLIRMGRRASSILENMYVLSISSTSGYVAGGTCFTMPAIYILKLNESLEIGGLSLFLQITFVPFLGAVLGVLFLIPFRRYFVKEMHGKLPFPEATATNEILVTGASGSTSQATILIYSFVISAVYTFVATGLKLFSDTFTTGMAALHAGKRELEVLAFGDSGIFATLTSKVKAVLSMGTGAYYLGLGVIIGPRYASIICAGSFLSALAITPLLGGLDLPVLQSINPKLQSTAASDIWFHIPRVIGIGTIFAAGLISILKMSGVIVTALRQALGGLVSGKGRLASPERTDEDLGYGTILGLGALVVILMAIFFRFVVLSGMENATSLTIISVILALVVAFLFTTVSAWAIAMISVTPISGMTVTTIIITAVVLSLAGLPKGPGGMLATLLVGGVVCTTLSLAGGLVTNFKLGYWLGASPKRITWNAIGGSLVSAVFVAGTIMVLAYKPGYTGAGALSAPQATMMASTLESFLGAEGEVPWLLYGVGVVVAVTIQLLGISPLAFGLGMYLPMSINLPILIGAFVALLVKKGKADPQLSKARGNKAILIASGFIAGGAIMEVLVNVTGAVDDLWWGATVMPFLDLGGRFVAGGADPAGLARTQNLLGLVLFVLLCVFLYGDCRRAKKELAAGGELG
ncbi:MAG: OPT/YSL family transporter [Planctomycetota bacterium]